MGEFIDAFRKTLKPRETEEFPNSWIFRPLAFLLIVYPASKIKFISPNLLTCCSLFFGLLMAFFITQGLILPAAAAMLLMVLFDCSDGQLARLTGKSSKIGKILDVSADVISYLAFFTACAIAMYTEYRNVDIFWLIPLSFISVAFNVVFYDQFKNQYIRYVYTNYHETLEHHAALKKQAKQSKGVLKKAAMYVYYGFYKAGTSLLYLGSLVNMRKHNNIFSLEKEITKDESVKFRNHFFFMTRLWSLIGTGTHYFIMIIILLCFGVDKLLPVFIIYSFGMLVLLLIIQNIVFAFYKIPTKTKS